MKKFLGKKSFLSIILVLGLSLILAGCGQENVNADELLPESIEAMKGLESYTSNVHVKFVSESDESGYVNMEAGITYHKEPFAYSNIQAITSSNQNPDNPFEKLILSLIVKDGTIYTNNSITGLWVDETDANLVKEIENNGDFFTQFTSDQFTDLEVVSVNKRKANIKARANSSAFITGLLNSFDTNTLGDVELTIDTETKYMESLIFYPEFNGKQNKENKITITTKDFNTAPEVVVPKEAIFE